MANLFLKIDTIAGESTDAKHKDEIEIESFSWGVANSGSAGTGGGAGTGKAQFDDITFVARTSKASPRLFLATASGTHLKDARLTVRKPGEKPVEFLKITLQDVLISSFRQAGGDGEEVPVEQFGINFAKFEVSYSPQRPDGTLDSEIKAGWDLKKNGPV